LICADTLGDMEFADRPKPPVEDEQPQGWLPEKGHPDRIGVYVGLAFFSLLVLAIVVSSLLGFA
jgi:hypothetical protein